MITLKTKRSVYIIGHDNPNYKAIKKLVEGGDSGEAYKLYKDGLKKMAMKAETDKIKKKPKSAPIKKTAKPKSAVKSTKTTPASKSKTVSKAAPKTKSKSVSSTNSKRTKKATKPQVIVIPKRDDTLENVNPKSKFILTVDGIWFSTKKANYTVHKNHPYFEEIKEALEKRDTGGAYRLFVKKDRKDERVKVVGNEMFIDDTKLDSVFTEAYLNAKSNGVGFAAISLFFENLAKNPNPISVDAFKNFLSKTMMPITNRGTFLAYRRCSHSFRDHHTGNFSNIPGAVCRMKREDCDAKQTNTCSTGFHVCSVDYLNKFSSGVDLVVEINPRDVVAVPPDYDLSKMRVSSMRILCTVDMFREKTQNFKFDCLTAIPFFEATQVYDWDVLAGIPSHHIKNNESLENGATMSAEDWLKLDPI